MSVVVGGEVVMVGGEWLWLWWVAVVVVRGDRMWVYISKRKTKNSL
jgi:hypothetical protein